MPRVDYDQIAHVYDEPLRDKALDQHPVAFLADRPDLAPDGPRVLDVGCGTGKQLVANQAAYSGLCAVGLDPFAGMLAIARERGPSLTWVQADGARLPFRPATFDYATNHFSYHHISGKQELVAGLFRALAPAGRFVLVNIDPWSMAGWHIYQLFPEAHDLDLQHFLPSDAIVGLLVEAGFVEVQVGRQWRQSREPLADVMAYVSLRHRVSQLMALPDDVYQARLQRLEHAITRAEQTGATIDSESCLLTIRADVPMSGKPT